MTGGFEGSLRTHATFQMDLNEIKFLNNHILSVRSCFTHQWNGCVTVSGGGAPLPCMEKSLARCLRVSSLFTGDFQPIQRIWRESNVTKFANILICDFESWVASTLSWEVWTSILHCTDVWTMKVMVRISIWKSCYPLCRAKMRQWIYQEESVPGQVSQW